MTALNIFELLDVHIQLMARVGAPALAERFVKRNGLAFRGSALPKSIGRGDKRACFRNAYYLSARNGYRYVEGFALPALESIRFMPYAHAWVVDAEYNVLDNTWDEPEKCEYVGVPLMISDVEDALLQSGCFSVLDATRKGNRELMYRIDPELKNIISDITQGAL